MNPKLSKKLGAVTESITKLKEPFLIVGPQLGYPDEFLVALAATTAMCMLGMNTRLAAGSARWLLMTDEEQGEAMIANVKPLDYFGYDFELEAALAELVTMRVPDSMHVWSVDPDGVIYDFTGKLQMEQFNSLGAGTWPEKRALPEVISGTQADLAVNGWFYDEDSRATEFAHKLVGYLTMRTMHAMASNPPPMT